MKAWKTICLLIGITFFTYAQSDSDELIVRRIADYVLEHYANSFIDTANGAEYSGTEDIPEGARVRLKTPFQEWHYTNGVINMAMMNLAGQLNESRYFDYAARQIAFGMDNYKFLQSRFKKDVPHHQYPLGQLWTMEELDDCGAIGASMIEVYKKVKRADYRDYIDKTANHILNRQDRLEDGTLVRKFPHEMTIWADDLYMSVPFLARMGELTEDAKYWNDAILQIEKFTQYLWNDETGLYFHCYYSDLNRNGIAHWGRSNGWVMMAQVHLLNILPEDHPKRAALIANLERQILGVAKYQDANGLWHQVLNRMDSYSETSCTAMFTYCIARAANKGWIDHRYASIARNGWEGMKKHKIQPDGQVKDICVGTGIEDNMVFYYNRPTALNDTHGIDSVIDAGVEIIRMKK